MEHSQANLANLCSLWQVYGANRLSLSVGANLQVNQSWPHRSWFDQSVNHQELVTALMSEQQRRQQGVICPVWPSFDPTHQALAEQLVNNQWQISFSQTAMQLPVATELPRQDDSSVVVQLQQVTSLPDLLIWRDIASSAFNYEIDAKVIELLLSHPDTTVFLASVDQHYVGTALFYQTGDYLGVHQVAVAPQWQGRGIAYQLMVALMAYAQTTEAKHLVLQASMKGLPLYQKLGFNTLFTIDNYRWVQ